MWMCSVNGMKKSSVFSLTGMNYLDIFRTIGFHFNASFRMSKNILLEPDGCDTSKADFVTLVIREVLKVTRYSADGINAFLSEILHCYQFVSKSCFTLNLEVYFIICIQNLGFYQLSITVSKGSQI